MTAIRRAPRLQKGRAETLPSNDQGPPSPSAPKSANVDHPKPSAPKTYPLGMVLEACPDILDYATKGGVDLHFNVGLGAFEPVFGTSIETFTG